MAGEIDHLTDKGFGFIKPEGSTDHTKGIFFHLRELRGIRYEDLRKGDRVTFEVEETEKGLAARNIRVA